MHNGLQTNDFVTRNNVVGQLRSGDEVYVLETRTSKGVTRARCLTVEPCEGWAAGLHRPGWVHVTMKNGTVVLKDTKRRTEASSETESEPDTSLPLELRRHPRHSNAASENVAPTVELCQGVGMNRTVLLFQLIHRSLTMACCCQVRRNRLCRRLQLRSLSCRSTHSNSRSR